MTDSLRSGSSSFPETARPRSSFARYILRGFSPAGQGLSGKRCRHVANTSGATAGNTTHACLNLYAMTRLAYQSGARTSAGRTARWRISLRSRRLLFATTIAAASRPRPSATSPPYCLRLDPEVRAGSRPPPLGERRAARSKLCEIRAGAARPRPLGESVKTDLMRAKSDHYASPSWSRLLDNLSTMVDAKGPAIGTASGGPTST